MTDEPTREGHVGRQRGVRTAQDLVERIEKDPWLADEIKKNPARAIAAVAQPPLETDVWIYRIVVLSLGLAVLISLGGGIAIVMVGKTVPDILVALGSAAVGALAGLLAPSPTKKSD
jgi:hypothetical protein